MVLVSRRYARARDACEPAIVTGLQAIGAVVHRNSDDGVPDLLVSYHGDLHLLECKDHRGGIATRVAVKRNSGRERFASGEPAPACLTPAQVKWWHDWLAGGGKRPTIVYNLDEAIAAIGAPPVIYNRH